MNDAAKTSVVSPSDAFLKSVFYEKLTEHVFISEVLQEAWFHFGKTAEVLRSEVDASGYDIVIECNDVLRHIQLKTSKADAKTAGQKVNVALATKPSGCIVWLIRHDADGRMRLTYRFFGGAAGQPLPSLAKCKTAKHTKGTAKGVKNERPSIRIVPKSAFEKIESTGQLVGRLFNLSEHAVPARVESCSESTKIGDGSTSRL